MYLLHILLIFGDTFRMLRNIWIVFHFLDEDNMRKIITTMIRPKLEYTEIIWSLHKKKHVLKLERTQRIATKMEIGLGRKIGISQSWNPQNWREHCTTNCDIPVQCIK